MNRGPLLVAIVATCGSALANCAMPIEAAVEVGRPAVVLDGVWRFATDPQDRGESEQWYLPGKSLPKMPLAGYRADADGRITVPGSWDMQGYGEPNKARFYQFVGKGWYTQTAEIPADWAGLAIYLKIGGVHRSAKVWVNGDLVGEHIGYLSALEFDVSNHVKTGETCHIVIAVDSRQKPHVDLFNGTTDGIEMKGSEWGGIWGHVSLEARDAVYLQDVWIQTVTTVPAKISLMGTLAGRTKQDIAMARRTRVEILDATGRAVTTAEGEMSPVEYASGSFNLKIPLDQAELWSPDHPALYTARVSLFDVHERLRDVYEQRFGVCLLQFEGQYIDVNGRRIFLASAGDDNIYPNQFGALYVGKDQLLERLKLMKAYGFNGVRTHSSVMSPDFYDACDEVGIFARPELPFSGTHQARSSINSWPDGRQKTKEELTSALIRLRNHPSIYAWSGGNELYSSHRALPDSQILKLSRELQVLVNRYQPNAYFVDSVNVGRRADIVDLQRLTLDFITPWHHHLGHPYEFGGLEVIQSPHPKPAIIHESHDYATFPHLANRHKFTDGIRPVWLDEMSAYYERLGLLKETELWEQVSEELYLDCVKCETEAIRLQDRHAGYDFWLFQDFWGTANGLVDYFFEPKKGIPAQVFRQFNNDTVLLKNGLKLTYRSGDTMEVTFLVSNYGPLPIEHGRLEYRIASGRTVLASRATSAASAMQGGVTSLAAAHLTLPDVSEPCEITISARLVASDHVYANDWSARLYPRQRTTMYGSRPVYTLPEWVKTFAYYQPQEMPITGALPAQSLYIVNDLDARLLQALQEGAHVVLIHPKRDILPVHRESRWRPAFWNATGPRRPYKAVGHLVYDHALTRAITPHHGLNHQWWRLFNGSVVFILDDMPAQPDVLVRSIDGPLSLLNKSLLFEAQVGKGRLIASGFNCLNDADCPEIQWVMDQIVRYAATDASPRGELPATWLRDRIAAGAKKATTETQP